MHLHRCTPSQPTCDGTGCVVAEGQIARGGVARNLMAGGAADGVAAERDCDVGSPGRSRGCQEAHLQRGPHQLVVSQPDRRQRRWEAEGKAEEQQREGRPSRREKGEGKGRRQQEVSAVPMAGALSCQKDGSGHPQAGAVPRAMALEPQRSTLVAGVTPPVVHSGTKDAAEEHQPCGPRHESGLAAKHREDLVRQSGATPKAHLPGVPLTGALSLSAFSSSSPFFATASLAGCSQQPSWGFPCRAPF